MGAQRINLVAGDHGQSLLFTIRDNTKAAPSRILDPYDPSTWAPHDLTRVTGIRIPVQPLDRSISPYPLTAAKQPPYTDGVCSIIWPPQLFAIPGRYEGEMSLEYAGGALETVYAKIIFIVRTRS